jgi:Ca-activated chloride channel family protein
MRFGWPGMLWLLVAVPVLVGAYVFLLWRKKKAALRFASVSSIRQAMTQDHQFRRHIPPLLFLLAMIVTIVAIARPTAHITLPSWQQTIILAVDVSLSMGATDVEPNRITAAQAAAHAFVDERPLDVRIGIVTFGGSASLVQPPTMNRDDLLEAITRFQLQRGTATGSALYVALAALLPEAGIDLESMDLKAAPSVNSARGAPLNSPRKSDDKAFAAVAPGSYHSGAIILMSDGRRTSGPDPLDAARVAADHGVRVFTVGIGTKEGGMVGSEDWSIYVRLDEETLQAIAGVTRGVYFHAGTAEDLNKVYRDLNARLVLERQDVEITSLLAAAAAVLLLASAALSLLWFNRIM